jgi:hypothetical protein
MVVFSNNLPLGFTNEDFKSGNSRVVVSHTTFGPINGNAAAFAGDVSLAKSKTAINFLLCEEARDYVTFLLDQKVSIDWILQRLCACGDISRDMLDLLGISVV